jgi:hypothetical protein
MMPDEVTIGTKYVTLFHLFGNSLFAVVAIRYVAYGKNFITWVSVMKLQRDGVRKTTLRTACFLFTLCDPLS